MACFIRTQVRESINSVKGLTISFDTHVADEAVVDFRILLDSANFAIAEKCMAAPTRTFSKYFFVQVSKIVKKKEAVSCRISIQLTHLFRAHTK